LGLAIVLSSPVTARLKEDTDRVYPGWYDENILVAGGNPLQMCMTLHREMMGRAVVFPPLKLCKEYLRNFGQYGNQITFDVDHIKTDKVEQALSQVECEGILRGTIPEWGTAAQYIYYTVKEGEGDEVQVELEDLSAPTRPVEENQ
jgi:hypothetical protein